MTSLYLGLAALLALTLNAGPAWLRAAGRLLAAAAMAMMAWSIVLANRDGTFAAVPPGNSTPMLLNIAAGLLAAGIVILLSGLPGLFRRAPAPVPPRSPSAGRG